MTPAAVLALAEAEGVSVTLNPDGNLLVMPDPSRDLDAGIGANVDALADVLRRRADWHRQVEEAFAAPDPCVQVLAQGPLPAGLVAIYDEAGRSIGWRLG